MNASVDESGFHAAHLTSRVASPAVPTVATWLGAFDPVAPTTNSSSRPVVTKSPTNAILVASGLTYTGWKKSTPMWLDAGDRSVPALRQVGAAESSAGMVYSSYAFGCATESAPSASSVPSGDRPMPATCAPAGNRVNCARFVPFASTP